MRISSPSGTAIRGGASIAAAGAEAEKFSVAEDRQSRTEALDRLRELTGVPAKEFRSLYGKRTRLRARLKLGSGDTTAITADLASVEKKMQGSAGEMKKYADLLAEVDRLNEELAKPAAAGGGAGKPPAPP